MADIHEEYTTPLGHRFNLLSDGNEYWIEYNGSRMYSYTTYFNAYQMWVDLIADLRQRYAGCTCGADKFNLLGHALDCPKRNKPC